MPDIDEAVTIQDDGTVEVLTPPYKRDLEAVKFWNTANVLTPDQIYGRLLDRIYHFGVDYQDRTGVGRRSLKGESIQFPNISADFPLLLSKKVWWRGVYEELFWFLRGETNIKSLQDVGVSIWDEWASRDGNVGPVYGKQWRAWSYNPLGTFNAPQTLDQLANVINEINTNPWSSRLVVSAWNPPEVPRCRLPPCHMFFQFHVEPPPKRVHSTLEQPLIPYYLCTTMYMRSADIFLGVPFNIASYALLTYIIGKMTGLVPKTLTVHFGDVHIYHNHFEQVQEQLARIQAHVLTEYPTVYVTGAGGADPKDYYGDVQLVNYNPMPAIKADVAV